MKYIEASGRGDRADGKWWGPIKALDDVNAYSAALCNADENTVRRAMANCKP